MLSHHALSCQVDLLIGSCDLVSAGHLRDPANVLPCIGNNPYKQDSAECSTEMQLYSASDTGIMILQQRAPPMLGRYCPPLVLRDHVSLGGQLRPDLQWRLWLAGRHAEQHLPGCLMACQSLSVTDHPHRPCAGRSRLQKLLLHSYINKGLKR